MKKHLIALIVSLVYGIAELLVIIITVDELYHGCNGGDEIGLIIIVDFMMKCLLFYRVKRSSGLENKLMLISAWVLAGYTVLLLFCSKHNLYINGENMIFQLFRSLTAIGMLCFPVFLLRYSRKHAP